MPDSKTDFGRAENPGAVAGQADGLGLGDRLRSARKARAISLERIAEALNLDEAVVISLEEERFDELGAPVFVRGHLKAYAKIVGLSPDVVLDAYGVTEPQAVAVPTVERDVRRSVTINPVVWGVSSLVLLLGLVLTVYVMQDDDTEPVRVAAPEASVTALAKESVPVTLPVEQAVVEEAAPLAPVDRQEQAVATSSEPIATAQADESVADEPPVVAAVPEIESPTAAEPVTVPVARPQADVVRLSLHFREESWVEISDANQRLLFGLQREGRRRELSGEPPFRLLIGNAAGVDLSVNDQPYAVPSAGVTGKVARFEISASAID